ncbi:methyltransferase domain-containing protein [Leptolyngbya sp. FACHB-17]|uniref:class I SAM-dependent methyltransferase n=1 Tax=unclassified Leptolyngbya TaxID=2650499 RepID=UPI0016811656|nr:methyltransferase domain-containing protein [Leptolyngbya sp. FACHB-17]MBD2082178.1 class I SAM-dependent methyltransferase [Leptolyngbya sp. FACHB-17]
MIVRPLVVCAGVFSLMFAGCSQVANLIPKTENQVQTQTANPEKQNQPSTPQLDVPYVPTPTEVVDAMLKVAKVGKKDVLYDLGSGDGRIPITAAKRFGTRGFGVDIDPERIKEANANAKKAGVSDRVKFAQQDLFKTDLSKASVITLYLLPRINLQLRSKLLKLKPGTRIVSHAFDMGDWKPDRVVNVKGTNVYFWTVPKTIPANLK